MSAPVRGALSTDRRAQERSSRVNDLLAEVEPRTQDQSRRRPPAAARATPPLVPPVRLMIVDCDIVVSGVAAMVATHRESVHVVDARARTTSTSTAVDILLVDPAGPGGEGDFTRLIDGTCWRVVAFSWYADPASVDRALALGAAGYLFKGLPAASIVRSLQAVRDGTIVTCLGDVEDAIRRSKRVASEAGLSPRESEVLGLITMGLTNVDIAARCHLSINSVKTYVRSAYRKIGVSRRSHAVRWGVEHGLRTDDPGHVRRIGIHQGPR
jgi:two-component system, NarL family, response regulator LiaR